MIKITKQIVPYSQVDNARILEELLAKEAQEMRPENLSKLAPLEKIPRMQHTLNEAYENYISELESRNIENVDHYKQLCQHEKDIILNTKNHRNLEELAEYKDSVLAQIDPTLPPYFIPHFSSANRSKSFIKSNTEVNGDTIVEPYSELEDYLDKNDFSNLLGVIGQFAGKTSSGLVSFGESILNQFVFKKKEEEKRGASDNGSEEGEYVVPGQKQEEIPPVKSQVFNIPTNQSLFTQENQQDYKNYVKKQAQAAGQKLSFLGKGVWGIIGGQGNQNAAQTNPQGEPDRKTDENPYMK